MKDFLKTQFAEWYSKQVYPQLEEEDTSDCDVDELQSVNLSLLALKELGAKWLVDAAMYNRNNPQMIVNEFIHSVITGALDGQKTDDQAEPECDMDLESRMTASEDESVNPNPIT